MSMNAQPYGAFDLFIVDIKTGDVEQLTFAEDADIYNASFSNDGKHLVADALFDGFQILGIVDVTTGEGYILPETFGGNDASWSPNGNMIVYDGTRQRMARV